MPDAIYNDSKRRHDFVLLFDVTDGNPNGDPEAENLPRVDPETMHGLVTDVCLKRKVRNYVDVTKGTQQRFKIYVQDKGVALNTLHERAYSDLGLKSTGSKQKRLDVEKAKEWMCENFYDIRTFGAVMSTEVNCGQVRGPLQLTFARSIDPVIPLEVSITRVAITRQQDAEVAAKEAGEEEGKGKRTEMGHKALVPYGLYRSHGFYNPFFAQNTKFDDQDLTIFWEALEKIWDLDRSAARGLMAWRGLYVFSHAGALGNAPAHVLFDRISVKRRADVEAPRFFSDYEVEINGQNLPSGITLTRLVG